MMHRDIDTQFGPLILTEEDGVLVRLAWGRSGHTDQTDVLDAASLQMKEYDAGTRTTFDVCDAMRAIPFGETLTYGDIARSLGVPAQAIGQACGKNPIPIIIPCHRVMGAKGLTGFSGAGGVETKVALLRHEGAGSFLI